MRIYVVNHSGKERLVEANTPQQAVMHVARGLITPRIARSSDVARLMKDGTVVESIQEGNVNAS